MAIRLNFNSAAVRSHFQLNQTDRSLNRVMEQLSSGERIRRAADDPAAMALSKNLRHQIGGLTQATDNIEEGVAMLNTAEAGMGEITAVLNRMRELAINAANTGPNSTETQEALQQELEQAVRAINTIATDTTYSGAPLLDGSLSDNRLTAAAREVLTDVSQDDTQLPGGIQPDSAINVDPASGTLTRSRVAASFAGTPAATDLLQGRTLGGTTFTSIAGETMTITGANGTGTINLGDNLRIRDLVGLINAQGNAIGVQAEYNESTGEFVVESLNYGDSGLNISTTDFNLNGAGVLDSNPETADPLTGDDTGVVNSFLSQASDQTIDINYTDEDGLPQLRTLTQDGTSVGGLTFTDGVFSVSLRDEGDGSVGSTLAPASQTVSAIREGTTFIQNGGLANQIERLEIPDMRAGALGHDADGNTTGFEDLQDLADLDALTGGDQSIADAIRVIDAALADVTNARGRIGAQVQDNLERTMDSLRVATESLQTSESVLKDTDYAQASAEFSRLNILFQASTSMMAQANQLPNSVLQLLQ